LAGQHKKALEEGYTIVWGDESGFSLRASLFGLLSVAHAVAHGRAHVGAARADANLTRPADPRSSLSDPLSAISGSTLDGRLLVQMREPA
jgi:hypothetical protein